MATGFSFEVKGLDKLLKVFHELPERTQQELAAELDTTAGEIRDGAKRDAPTDEARLKQSINKNKTGPLEFEAVAQTFYAGYLEFGTKTKAVIPAGLEDIASQLKGPVGGQGNPIDALTAWVKRKGIVGTFNAKGKRKLSTDQQARQVAFVIWRHIKRFGIKAQPYFFKQMAPAEQRLRQRLANIIKSLIE